MNSPLIRQAKQRAAIIGRRGLRKKPIKVPDPRNLERKYQAELIEFVESLEKETEKLLIERLGMLHDEAHRFDAWADDVENIVSQLNKFSAIRMETLTALLNLKAAEVGDWNTRQFKRSIRAVLGVDVVMRDANVSDMLSSWVKENANLIKSIPEQYLTQVEGITQRGLRGGLSVSDIQSQIRDRFEVTESRARLIARDQIGKLNGQITRTRQKALDIQTYWWQTGGDERVRDSHKVLNGKLCRWDDPTVYSDDEGKTWKKRSSIGGVEQHPGEDFQCRCNGAPNLIEILGELGVIDDDKDAGKADPVPTKEQSLTPEPEQAPQFENLSLGYGGRFDSYIADVKPESKAVISKLRKPDEILERGAYKGSYYRDSSISGSDTSGTLVAEKSKGKTVFLHEYGHHVDYNIARSAGSKDVVQRSMGKDFLDARKEDIAQLVKRHEGKNIYHELRDRLKGQAELNGVSDVVDSLTGGVFHSKYGMPGHGTRYYNAKGTAKKFNNSRKQTETFAQLFEAYSQDGKAWREMQDLFPSQSRLFEKVIKEFIE